MSLDQIVVLRVVAIQTQCWSILGQVLAELALGGISCLMCDMASVTAHVKSRVPAAVVRDTYPLVMTIQAKILVFCPGERL